MESNGVKFRIHVSEATRDALVAQGKASWLTPREDKIAAKGKGELQTHWVTVFSKTMSTVSSAISYPVRRGSDEASVQQAGVMDSVMEC